MISVEIIHFETNFFESLTCNFVPLAFTFPFAFTLQRTSVDKSFLNALTTLRTITFLLTMTAAAEFGGHLGLMESTPHYTYEELLLLQSLAAFALLIICQYGVNGPISSFGFSISTFLDMTNVKLSMCKSFNDK